MIIEKISLSKEMYTDARGLGLSFSAHLENVLKKNGKFNESCGMNGFQQQLAARDLRLSGAHAALIEDFFKTSDHKILFPEVINQTVRVGMLEELELFAGLKDLIATSTGIDGISYNSSEVDIASSTDTAGRVGEFGDFPTVTIKFKDQVIKLTKYGYKIKASYETVRRMKVNVFAVTMKVLGRNITKNKISDAVSVLINGDGNSNAISSINAATNGTLAYADTINLKYAFEYFQPSLMIAPKAMAIAYENLAEYKDKNGPTMPKPPKVASAMPAGKIIALDSAAALEEVHENNSSLVETDKIIDKQFEQAVVSEVAGWSILFRDAAKMLNVTF